MRTLRDIPSAVFTMSPSLICGALATGESGQIDVGSLFGRHLRSAVLIELRRSIELVPALLSSGPTANLRGTHQP